MKHPHCCHYLTTVTPIASPFNKNLVLGYSDGALAGVMQCGYCERAYRFDLLTWGEGKKTRIVSLAPLPAESFARLVELITQVENAAPQWPFWCPRWQFPTETEKTLADLRLWEMLQTASAPQLVLAIDPWIRQVWAAREVTPEQMQTVTDWFAFLQISRNDPHGHD